MNIELDGGKKNKSISTLFFFTNTQLIHFGVSICAKTISQLFHNSKYPTKTNLYHIINTYGYDRHGK